MKKNRRKEGEIKKVKVVKKGISLEDVHSMYSCCRKSQRNNPIS